MTTVGPFLDTEEVALPRIIPRPVREGLQRFTVTAALTISLVLQAVHVGLLEIMARQEGAQSLAEHPAARGISITLQAVQAAVIMIAMLLTLRSVWRISLGTAVLLYLTVLLAFAGFYHSALAVATDAFSFSGPLAHAVAGSNPLEMFALTVYYSVQVQSHTGFGDMNPRLTLPQAMSGMQMGLGLLFTVWILTQTLQKFTRPAEARPASPGTPAPAHGRLHWISRWRPLKTARKTLRKYLLAFVLALQITLFVVLIEYGGRVDLGHKTIAQSYVIVVSAGVFVLQVLAVIMTASKYAVRKTHRITVSFIVQAWLSVAVVFAGLFTMTFLASTPTNRAFFVPAYAWEQKTDPDGRRDAQVTVPVLPLLFEAVYYSLSTLSSTGMASFIPLTAIAQLLVMVEMLMQVIFTVVIFGYGLSHSRGLKLEFAGQNAAGGRARPEAGRYGATSGRYAPPGTEAGLGAARFDRASSPLYRFERSVSGISMLGRDMG